MQNTSVKLSLLAKRLLAALIDMAIISSFGYAIGFVLITGALGIALFFAVSSFGQVPPDWVVKAFTICIYALGVLAAGIFLYYWIGYQVRTSKTPGKQLLQLAIVSPKMNFWRYLMRELIKYLPFTGIVLLLYASHWVNVDLVGEQYGLGWNRSTVLGALFFIILPFAWLATFILSARGRFPHDMICGTEVHATANYPEGVERSQPVTQPAQLPEQTSYGTGAPAADLPNSARYSAKKPLLLFGTMFLSSVLFVGVLLIFFGTRDPEPSTEKSMPVGQKVPQPPDTSEYRNEEMGFKLAVPVGWEAQSEKGPGVEVGDEVVHFMKPDKLDAEGRSIDRTQVSLRVIRRGGAPQSVAKFFEIDPVNFLHNLTVGWQDPTGRGVVADEDDTLVGGRRTYRITVRGAELDHDLYGESSFQDYYGLFIHVNDTTRFILELNIIAPEPEKVLANPRAITDSFRTL